VVSALQAMRPERMFADVLFIGVLAIALNACLVVASRRLLPGHTREAAGA
jgi:ABC-type nitrate/sulfonate/bicarbonate transport system permease component